MPGRTTHKAAVAWTAALCFTPGGRGYQIRRITTGPPQSRHQVSVPGPVMM
jgi:hypothetical protein